MKRRTGSSDFGDKINPMMMTPFQENSHYQNQFFVEHDKRQPLHYSSPSDCDDCNNTRRGGYRLDWSPANPQSAPSATEYDRYRVPRAPSSGSSTTSDRKKKSFDVSSSHGSNYGTRAPRRFFWSFSGERKTYKSTFSLAVAGFCIIGLALYGSSRVNLTGSLADLSGLLRNNKHLNSKLLDTRKHVQMLQRELSALDMMQRQQEDLEAEKMVREQAAEFTRSDSPSTSGRMIEDMNAMQRRITKSTVQLEQLQQLLTVSNKRDLRKKYGDGPVYVKLQLLFPDAESQYRIRATSLKSSIANEGTNYEPPNTSIVFEMAPMDLMPHSVYTFLAMVSEGLLDGCSFILNALHIVKAAPLPYDGSPAFDKVKLFHDLGLESVAFREYSSEYPHEKYTVGFVADGSPSFYINTEDNTEIHVGDPCFSKVVSGFETVQRIAESPTRNGIWLEDRIGIKKVTVMSKEEVEQLFKHKE